MHIERVRTVTPEIVTALERLVPQLTSNNRAPSSADLMDLVGSESNTLLVVREPDGKGEIVAAACLAVYRVTTGIRAVIEDIVVDEECRGRGIGEALLRHLMVLAKSAGAPGVSLTSSPRRAAANRLYVRMGFSRRETNAYYYSFTSG